MQTICLCRIPSANVNSVLNIMTFFLPIRKQNQLKLQLRLRRPCQVSIMEDDHYNNVFMLVGSSELYLSMTENYPLLSRPSFPIMRLKKNLNSWSNLKQLNKRVYDVINDSTDEMGNFIISDVIKVMMIIKSLRCQVGFCCSIYLYVQGAILYSGGQSVWGTRTMMVTSDIQHISDQGNPCPLIGQY